MCEDLQNIRRALDSSVCLARQYIVIDVLGKGGFGITYRGKNKTTNQAVAIKEYFPSGLAVRTEQTECFFLRPVSDKKEELFIHGRQHFLNEAEVLKKFQNLESIVSIYDVFEENNTAYIVMEYIEGPTLKQYTEENGCFCFSELLPLMIPVMQDLSIVHAKKLIHRDISPDNLILGTDNQLHLIDFGAAGHEDISGTQHTVILKSGYAPPEQYLSNSKAGAWIDVYALCATMYFALTGKPPSEAMKRLEQNSLHFPDTLTDLLPWQKSALEKGLHINMSRRFRSIEELYDALTSAPEPETQVTRTGISLTRREKQRIRHMRYRFRIPLFFFLLLILSVAILSITYAIKLRQIPSVKTAAETTMLSTSDTIPKISEPTAPLSTPETSEPPVLLSMPELSGVTLKKAKKMLKNLEEDIHIKTTYVYNKNVKKGQIISQNIAEGTLFSKGYFPDILLTISRGKKQTALPDKNDAQKPQAAKPIASQKPTEKATTPSNPIKAATPKPTKKTTTPPNSKNSSQKKSSPDYHLTPEDDDFVTVPLD